MCCNLGAGSVRHSAGESAQKAATMGHQERKGGVQDPSVDKQDCAKSEAMAGAGRGGEGGIGTPKSRTIRKCQCVSK